MLSQHPYDYIHCTYNATYVSAKPRSVISGLWCVVLLYIPERVDTLGLSVDCIGGLSTSIYTCGNIGGMSIYTCGNIGGMSIYTCGNIGGMSTLVAG